VIFGTTAVCNASCLHCPTNKDYRRDFPHGYMNFDLFTKIITELAEGGYPGWFLFGLFGEPLEDPLFERRLRLIKQYLPKARISVATNCGVYDPQKHAFIVDLADDIGVHVEGIAREVYDRFMHPLKSDRVFPKIVSLLSIDKANKVHITTPVHKGNLAEIPSLRRYFETYGATDPHFTNIGNRSWEGGPWSELALAPVGGWCHPSDLRTFVVDWDGAVLACCLDFAKSARLGDLSEQSVNEVLNGAAWSEMFEIHRTKSWAKKPACSRCRCDQAHVVQDLVQTLLAPDDRSQRLSARLFHLSPGVTRDDDGGRISVGEEAANGIVIYGPYRRISAGRYRVSHFLDVVKLGSPDGFIQIDIVEGGAKLIAFKGYPINRTGSMELDLEFESDGSITEFRVAKTGVEFVHKGALVHQL
jgi:radical SAM protein with 4Fe4S-binding SPASM domain